MIGNLSIRARLYALTAFGVLGLILMMTFSVTTEYKNLMESRQIKTRHLVEVAVSVVESYAKRVEAGELTEGQAKTMAMDAIKAMRYEGNEYFWINDMKPTMVMHPMKPEMDGTDLSGFADPNGKKLFVEFVNTVKANKGSGFVDYMWPKGKEKTPQPKLSYVKSYEPWGWIVGSGIYIDDVRTALMAYVYKTMAITGLALLMMLAVSTIIIRGINKGMQALLGVFADMVKFDFTKRAPIQNQDEIGRASESLNTVMSSVSEAIRDVMQSSQTMAAAAEEMAHSTVAVRDVSNAQQADIANISKASEDASAMVGEINQKIMATRDQLAMVSRSTKNANETMQNLKTMAIKVSEASMVINDISEQINLLALNAAIEAARAGDAGRGFAVVADEVRKLAANTAKSVSEISDVMSQLQQSVHVTSEGLHSISSEIEGINEDVMKVADAMVRQASMMTQISGSMEEFSGRMVQLSTSIEETNVAAASVAEESSKLSNGMARFRV